MAETIANPTVRITASTAGLDAGISSAQRQIAGFRANVEKSNAGFDPFGLARFGNIGKAGTIGLIAAVARKGAMEFAKVGEEISAVSRRLEDAGLQSATAADKVQLFGDSMKVVGERAAEFVTSPLSAAVKTAGDAFFYLRDTMTDMTGTTGPGTAAMKEWAKAAEQAAKAAEAARRPIESMLGSIQKEVATFGMSKDALEKYELAQLSATTADKDRLLTLQQQRAALEGQAEAQEIATKRAMDVARVAREAREDRQQQFEKAMKEAENVAAEINTPRMGDASPFQNPSILAAGSAGALSKIQELTNSKNVVDAKQLEALKSIETKMKELVKVLTGTGAEVLQVVNF